MTHRFAFQPKIHPAGPPDNSTFGGGWGESGDRYQESGVGYQVSGIRCQISPIRSAPRCGFASCGVYDVEPRLVPHTGRPELVRCRSATCGLDGSGCAGVRRGGCGMRSTGDGWGKERSPPQPELSACDIHCRCSSAKVSGSRCSLPRGRAGGPRKTGELRVTSNPYDRLRFKIHGNSDSELAVVAE